MAAPGFGMSLHFQLFHFGKNVELIVSSYFPTTGCPQLFPVRVSLVNVVLPRCPTISVPSFKEMKLKTRFLE